MTDELGFRAEGGVPAGVVEFRGKAGRGGELVMIESESLFEAGEIEFV